MPDRTVVAEQFVDLALQHKRWDEVSELPAEEMMVLFSIVSAAGFNPKALMLGKLGGYYRDDQGVLPNRTYSINRLCPFKVVDREGGDDVSATGWLDEAVRRVLVGSLRYEENRKELIEVIEKEIERSIPLTPIQLTADGDFLREYPPQMGDEYFVDHTRDSRELVSCVGLHAHCDGWMDRRRVTALKDAIVCRACHLRVLFPKEVKTYGDLRQALFPVTPSPASS